LLSSFAVSFNLRQYTEALHSNAAHNVADDILGSAKLHEDSNGQARFQVGLGKCSYRRPGVGRPPRITSARPYEQLPSSSSRSGMLVYRFIVV